MDVSPKKVEKVVYCTRSGPGRRLVRRVSPLERLAPGEALFHAVPVVDALLTQLPAEVDFLALRRVREINQALVEVLHHAAGLLDLLDGFLQLGRELLALARAWRRAPRKAGSDPPSTMIRAEACESSWSSPSICSLLLARLVVGRARSGAGVPRLRRA